MPFGRHTRFGDAVATETNGRIILHYLLKKNRQAHTSPAGFHTDSEQIINY